MARTRYTDATKARAVQLFRDHGAAEAARRLHADGTTVNPGTIRAWASRTGVATARREELEAHVATASLTAEARKANLAQQMLTIAEAAAAKELELLDTADLRSVVGARTRAIHDLQLLTGAATSRTETTAPDQLHSKIDELAQRRARVA